jgi:hypothetical protein
VTGQGVMPGKTSVAQVGVAHGAGVVTGSGFAGTNGGAVTTGIGVVLPTVTGTGSGEYSATLTFPFASVGAALGYGDEPPPAADRPSPDEHDSV